MTWSAPMTAVAGATFSDVEYNRYIRDNLAETFPARADAAGQYFVSHTHIRGDTRTSGSSFVAGSDTTTSVTYVTLTNDSTVSLSSRSQILVWFGATMSNNTSNASTRLSVKIKGPTNFPAQDRWSICLDGIPTGNAQRMSSFHKFTLLKYGTYDITLQARVAAGTTGTFSNRRLAVMPL